MSETCLTTDELSERIHCNPRTIRDRLKDSGLLEGVHYFRPFGSRKILYIWEAIERDMKAVPLNDRAIPMAGGGVCNAGKCSQAPGQRGTVVRLPVPRSALPRAHGPGGHGGEPAPDEGPSQDDECRN